MEAKIIALPLGDNEVVGLRARVDQLEAEISRLRASAQLASDVLRKASSLPVDLAIAARA
jgi:hypothetical protein